MLVVFVFVVAVPRSEGEEVAYGCGYQCDDEEGYSGPEEAAGEEEDRDGCQGCNWESEEEADDNDCDEAYYEQNNKEPPELRVIKVRNHLQCEQKFTFFITLSKKLIYNLLLLSSNSHIFLNRLFSTSVSK